MKYVFIILLAISSIVNAECIRIDLSQRSPDAVPGFDGIGAFGELHNTVSLGCLKYVGSMQKDGRESVLIKDERGTIHTLRVGSRMGENDGQIVEIDDKYIHILQIRGIEGKAIEVTVKFPKIKTH